MGFCRKSDFVLLYNRVIEGCRNNNSSVLIVSSPTVDAICALKTITVLSWIIFRNNLRLITLHTKFIPLTLILSSSI